jgi:hypothetical protein
MLPASPSWKSCDNGRNRGRRSVLPFPLPLNRNTDFQSVRPAELNSAEQASEQRTEYLLAPKARHSSQPGATPRKISGIDKPALKARFKIRASVLECAGTPALWICQSPMKERRRGACTPNGIAPIRARPFGRYHSCNPAPLALEFGASSVALNRAFSAGRKSGWSFPGAMPQAGMKARFQR